jgi:hypothetical protein
MHIHREAVVRVSAAYANKQGRGIHLEHCKILLQMYISCKYFISDKAKLKQGNGDFVSPATN